MALILVADDHAPNREYLTTLLGYSGYQTVEAADGQQALELARAHHPDLFLIDLRMPVMDGIAFARAVQADPDLASIPLVFCSASYRMREAVQTAGLVGIRHILPKPAEPLTVLSMVDAVLKRSGGGVTGGEANPGV